MRIQSIETFSTKEVCLVRIRTDSKEEGFGQVAPYHANLTAEILHQQIAPHVLGEDPMDIEGIVDRSIEAEHKFPGSYICRAVGGIDTALWDLKGKIEGKSVCELLGGKPKPIKAYGSSMRRDISPQDEADRLKRLMDSQGFDAFKIRIANNFGKNVDVWPGRTEEIVPAVRRAIGDDATLLVDANSGYTPEKAIEVGRMLETYHVGHFEEPCPYPEIEWTAEVTKALNIPVAGGEQDNCLSQWKRMINMRAVDIVQPDVCYLGGISRTLKVAKMAKEAGLPCTPHAANLSMVTVFTLHLLGAIENAGPYVELSIEDTPWTKDLFHPVLNVVDGMVDIPSGNGWGIEISEEWLRKANYKITELKS
ncbi:mandelate racemase/muconate lactonizing enzyme family protein [Halalkalibacter kiskunsagensis]|uniref:Mandelate racemase/muconate lactonizing enzyme family protein n=1 Tax=Halalkalibacter kiskunsagensis TaxID=1548599 RepID=A0ABV6KHS9_9BACI